MSNRNNKEQCDLPIVGEEQSQSRDVNFNNEIESSTEQVRPVSDVFYTSPEAVMDSKSDCSAPSQTHRTHLDSGYQTGISTSSAEPDHQHNTAAHFYISQTSTESDQLEIEEEFAHQGDILLENSETALPQDDSDLSEDDCSDFGEKLVTLREAETPISSPLNIPRASSFHQAYDPALRLMGATPPRAYIVKALASINDQGSPVNITGHHFSTGCLSSYAPMNRRMSEGKVMTCGEVVERGLRVTSGHMHASSSRSNIKDAELQRHRTTSDSVSDDQNCGTFIKRDRSKSAPAIGVREIVEKQCAVELRKISDEFFQEFPRVIGKSSRVADNATPVSKTTHASSYPGTSSRQWWWQTIIQNLSPAKVRIVESSGTCMTTIADSEHEQEHEQKEEMT